ncbi:MAG: pyrroline-5-carboxylate reductase [Cetobacterium sp.]|uniref:pyrroline-5-carboxylate reductase n=1 Tax=Cetobacterium sp. TaxID=2071632 RepID=UPI002FCA6FD6
MKIGFIGAGNMSQAIIKGIISSKIVSNEDIYASDKFQPVLEKVSKEYGVKIETDNKNIVKNCDVIFLAVKPQFYASVIQEISNSIKENTLIVTIAPGQILENLENTFGKKVKIVRTMPNTPAMVCEGMTAICSNDQVTEEELKYICSLLNSIGKTEIVSEHLMDAVVGVSGSSPAYVYMFIEALADGAVMEGMPRDLAYKFAAQTVLGSAKMVLETGMHPGALKDMVCSPGGTTIEAVRILEAKGMRSSIIEAVKGCVAKAKGLK